ncbi:MAG: helix-turn-helix domain-containing protein [Sphingomonadales bacterium]|nr:helix-turn-helix domain-containing protein [Sphingomonadales bacterium]
MAIAAHLDVAADAGRQPRPPRRQLRLATQGQTATGGSTDVLIHNVSATGLLLESKAELAAGERIEIDLPHARTTAATVIWSSGALYGCQFDAPITTATLSAAQLRGTAGQTLVAAPLPAPVSEARAPDETFGVRLLRLRRQASLTLGQLAAALGVSKPTVWAWEQDKARPALHRLDALANALGVPVSELTGKNVSPAGAELLARCREQIALAFGTSPERVRIMLEL